MMRYFRYSVIFFCLVCPLVKANVIRVGKDQKFRSVSSALSVLGNNDTLLIYEGVYKEGNLIIDKSVVVKGVNFPVIDGEGKYEMLTITADNVTVSGLLLKGSGKSSLNDLAAIKVQHAKNVIISGNRLRDNYFGIYLAKSSDCVVSKNDIKGSGLSQQGSGNGIHLWKCQNIRIENNESRGHRDGIYFEFVTESSIIKNISENNLRYGLHFMFSDNDEYHGNYFKDNGAGVAVMYSKNVKMTNNTFDHNWGSGAYGILLKDIRDSEIFSNIFKGNTTGIYAESASRIIVTTNSFLRNGWALRITSSCDEIQVNGNNFVGNTFDMATATSNNITQNSFDGNYWDKYEGYDLNRDKTGDVPYYPVSLSTMLVEKIPTSAYFLHSFVLNLINQSEKMLPNLIPQGIKDSAPLMKKLQL